MKSAQILPVTLLTGFLGSGKTTLLNRLLQARPRSAVLMNELGDIGLDQHLVAGPERVPVVLLSGGCICCQVKGNLAPALKNLWMSRSAGSLPAYDRIIIETTGLADPTSVIETLVRERWIAARHRLDAVVAVVDGVFGLSQLDKHVEALRQVAAADLLVVSKTDLVGESEIRVLREHLAGLNLSAPIRLAQAADFSPAEVLDLRAQRPQAVADSLAKPMFRPLGSVTAGFLTADRPHDPRIRSYAYRHQGTVSDVSLQAALSALEPLLGPGLLRFKGIVNLTGAVRPLVLQGVQGVLYPPTELDAWPDADRSSRFVWITEGLEEVVVTHAIEAFASLLA
ncbi:MAG: GTP-binding protein [Chromatiales bacterium]|nr:GTP-binding protein [Chromatiales bacterium]